MKSDVVRYHHIVEHQEVTHIGLDEDDVPSRCPWADERVLRFIK